MLIAWSPGMWEIVMILAVFLIMFGGKKLPGLARSLGSSVTEFKKGIRGDEGEKKIDGGDDAEAPPPPPAT